MSLSLNIIIFIAAALTIGFAGTALTRYADKLADKTGLGEAFIGAVFLGAVTSIAGIITSISAAYNGRPELAVSNAIGGIAAQTLFLCIADVTYRKVNLEHAAASLSNIMHGVLLIGLLILVLLGAASPDFTILNVHPISIIIFLIYIVGTRLISRSEKEPMWSPKKTSETVPKRSEEDHAKEVSLKTLIFKFFILSVVVGASGYVISITGIAISDMSNLSDGLVGSLFTAVATSLPELVVTLAAVRQKALALAVANIIGGNSFDVLFVAFSDVAYQDGSILHSINNNQTFTICMTTLMVCVLIMGLLFRERKGFANIGWESALIMFIYLIGNLMLYFLF